MKLALDKIAVTEKYLTLGVTVDYGGPIRFLLLQVEVERLVDTELYGYLGKAAQARADREYRDWCEQQDMLFD